MILRHADLDARREGARGRVHVHGVLVAEEVLTGRPRARAAATRVRVARRPGRLASQQRDQQRLRERVPVHRSLLAPRASWRASNRVGAAAAAS